MTTALIFPGQGSQAIGMGQALAAAFPIARETLQEVDDALSQPLSKLMAEGPDAELTSTENAQPAIMAVSVAAFRVLQKETGLNLATDVACVAGHSLGEYSALTAAGTFSLAECARLLRIRGNAMQAAVPAGKGGMVAIIGPDFAGVEEIVRDARARAQGEIIEIANQNSTNQTVISGSARGMEVAIEVAKEKGAKRALALPVSAPFHCSMMQPAADAMRTALASASMQQPLVPVVANVTADYVADADAIRELLVAQVTGMVRWVDSIETMKARGITRVIELGHGNVLTGLIKRIAPEIATVNIGAPTDLDSYANAA
ncbi:MAG: [acyl-carrier-protein] S-malonyltransferase [Azospirillum brasilense]|nr:MAG: [acyl-carrier-protein] S-malonyltransferase [Azospirillum brasilense]